ncbi:MAG: hypothetical protein ACK4RK_03180 [Gemmataceae bacterium]
MSDRVSCPYCNSLVPMPEEAGPPDRISCPRCGEAFPYRPAEVSPAPAPAAPVPEPAAAVPTVSRRSNRSVAGVVLGIMGGMALVGLVLALMTVSQRRAYDVERPPRRENFKKLLVPVAVSGLVVIAVGTIGYLTYRGWRQRHPEAAEQSDPRAEVRHLLYAVVSLMIGTAVLLTVLTWNLHQDAPPGPSGTLPVRAVPPWELDGLGYLPPASNVILGVHVAEAWQSPLGRDVVGQLHLSPNVPLRRLPEWSGLALEQIDHLVVGTQLGDRLPPPTVVVIRTRAPYDAAKVLEKLQASRLSDHEGKQLHRFRLPDSIIDLELWCADARTLVVGFNSTRLSAVPATPALNPAFAAPLQDWLRHEQASGAQVWLIGQLPPPEKVPALLKLTLPPDDFTLLTQIRQLGVWIELEPEARVSAEIDCATEKAAETIAASLIPERGHDLLARIVFGPDDQYKPLLERLVASLRTERQATRVMLRAAEKRK